MRALSTAASAVRHTLGAAMEALLIVAIVAALAVGVALSTGHPAGASGVRAATAAPSISVPNGVYAGTDVATVDPPTGSIWVDARCYQGSVLVYEQWAAVNASMQATLTLGPTPSWMGGAASCTATANVLQRSGRFKQVASTSFSVAAS